MSKKIFQFCSVLGSNQSKAYPYINDIGAVPGDFVIIPNKIETAEKVGLVLETNEYTEENAPRCPQYTKHVIRKFSSPEEAKLEKEKKQLEKEKSIFFKNGKLVDVVTDISDAVQLSDDGKIMIGIKSRKTRGRIKLCIPEGVVEIAAQAFYGINFEILHLPKSLKKIGEYNLKDSISSIEVEKGNTHFITDKIGLYAVDRNQRQLLYVFDKTIEEYTAADDVVSFASGAFGGCSNLKRVILSPFTEEFNAYALFTETFIPASVKHLILRLGNTEETTVRYQIDEKNDCFFRDEDSIYEVLQDGSYKLLVNSYFGKGKALILDGTSEIGPYAFSGNTNLIDISFPKTLREIGRSAFYDTGLRKLDIPEGVVSIEAYAFSCCKELISVELPASLTYIHEDAFGWCNKLKKVTKRGNNSCTFKNGQVFL